ncbi:GAF and ANTAR domain-containing protein [Pseudonocardia charpentierae]|uniref:GAF and ANTAR domain-containing protein n=1 Tax=Pseudonocardia charpentierae TaxID=3075545 RepID=A0ABU2NCP0_9PSEU|nr:GAF and ANTAR domain-containing protein [Pseudonocardia sp. DSM 45834]MDT0351634.1 GAF and ANTAR domain-containing protein [Pseudonocardia sp. DSM 45834]
MTQALIRLAGHGHDDRHAAAEICRACVACLDVDGAAISLLTATASRETLSATDPTAATLEDLQFTLGEGACMEAALSGRPVLVPDIDDHVLTTRWPMFAGAVAEQTDVRALFALPLQLGTINLGVLDLYRTTPGPLRRHELRDALAAADTATLMLLAVPAHTGDAHVDGPPVTEGQHPDGRITDRWQADGDGEGRQMTRADEAWLHGLGCDGLWNDRAEVHQATGMILVQLGISSQDAFVRLRAHAFAARRPVADVARDVVARRLVFTQDMD